MAAMLTTVEPACCMHAHALTSLAKARNFAACSGQGLQPGPATYQKKQKTKGLSDIFLLIKSNEHVKGCKLLYIEYRDTKKPLELQQALQHRDALSMASTMVSVTGVSPVEFSAQKRRAPLALDLQTAKRAVVGFDSHLMKLTTPIDGHSLLC